MAQRKAWEKKQQIGRKKVLTEGRFPVPMLLTFTQPLLLVLFDKNINFLKIHHSITYKNVLTQNIIQYNLDM